MKYFDDEYLNSERIAAAKIYGRPFPLEVRGVVKRIREKSAFLLELERKSKPVGNVTLIKRRK